MSQSLSFTFRLYIPPPSSKSITNILNTATDSNFIDVEISKSALNDYSVGKFKTLIFTAIDTLLQTHSPDVQITATTTIFTACAEPNKVLLNLLSNLSKKGADFFSLQCVSYKYKVKNGDNDAHAPKSLTLDDDDSCSSCSEDDSMASALSPPPQSPLSPLAPLDRLRLRNSSVNSMGRADKDSIWSFDEKPSESPQARPKSKSKRARLARKILGRKYSIAEEGEGEGEEEEVEEGLVINENNGGVFEWLDDEKQSMRVLLDEYFNEEDDGFDIGPIHSEELEEETTEETTPPPPPPPPPPTPPPPEPTDSKPICCMRILSANLMPPPQINIRMPFCEKSIDAFQKPFTQYYMFVKQGRLSWRVIKRFSDFRELHKALQNEFANRKERGRRASEAK